MIWVFWKLFRFLKPTKMLSDINYEQPWIKVTKFMTGHRGIPSKIKLRLFIRLFNRANDRAKLDDGGERKTLFFFRLLVWWHGNRDYRGFSKHSPWRYWPKKLFILNSWEIGEKLPLIKGWWSTSSNLPGVTT